ncbi:MAG: hypothetical protein FWD87_02210 [Spirochaetaceae bacterium]|nr:hypothetical protein [Spirochaetaceae bacterium]
MNIEKLKKYRFKLLVLFLIFFIVILPSIYVAISLAGKISAGAVIPGYYNAYAHIPNPIRTADKLFAHELFSDILATHSFYEYLPVVSNIRESGILEKKRVRFAGRGPLDWALFSDGKFIATWDMGILAPFVRFFVNLSDDFPDPNLHYVRAGRKSRFEYRTANNITYIQRYRNLLIISNNLELFESIIDGTFRNTKIGRNPSKKFISTDFDAGFLVLSDDVRTRIATSPMIGAFLENLKFSDFSEIALSILPAQIDASIISSITSDNERLGNLLSRDSKVIGLAQHLPVNTRNSVIYSIGSIEEIINASLAVHTQRAPVNLRQIDRSARIFLGTGLNDLLFSWTGTEIAVLQLEGNPLPVFVLQVTDEQKREEIFDRAFSPVITTENASLTMDVPEITQITLPRFLNLLLNMWGINFLEPYFIVQNDFLFISESAESLVSAISSIRKNNVLSETDVWHSLSKAGSDKSSLTLFYSLGHSLPSFLSGENNFADILRLYKQGLIRANITNNVLTVKLSIAQ